MLLRKRTGYLLCCTILFTILLPPARTPGTSFSGIPAPQKPAKAHLSFLRFHPLVRSLFRFRSALLLPHWSLQSISAAQLILH